MYHLKYVPEENQRVLRREYWVIQKPDGKALPPKFSRMEDAEILRDKLNKLLRKL